MLNVHTEICPKTLVVRKKFTLSPGSHILLEKQIKSSTLTFWTATYSRSVDAMSRNVIKAVGTDLSSVFNDIRQELNVGINTLSVNATLH